MLLIRIKCQLCENGRLKQPSFHDPLNPNKWKRCPYCDENGSIIIEAGVLAIAQYVARLDDRKRRRFLELLGEQEINKEEQ